MARYHCPCGHKFRLDGDTDNEQFLITYPLVEEMEDRLDRNDLSADDMNTLFVSKADMVYYCDKCRRLLVHNDKERMYYRYKVEETEPYEDEMNERLDAVYGPRQ